MVLMWCYECRAGSTGLCPHGLSLRRSSDVVDLRGSNHEDPPTEIVLLEEPRFESPIRDLASKLRDVAKEHMAYSQVADFMNHMESHLHALAFAEETNRRDRGATKL